ncbi:MAG: biopolymer transporter ExbD [Porphyromonadaceae bacterium]|jgi:biopolymer transport protein ExbD|nr:biopolymer transporter ExbD [Porphyromonadaceae bacterium]
MALKRRNKVESGFAMSSMTDIIFLLLLFFVISSTMTTPNDIKINLPQSGAKTATEPVVARVSIDKEGQYFLAAGKNQAYQVQPELLEQEILTIIAQDTTTFLALYADQDIAYKEVVRVLDIANKNKLKLVIATSAQTQEDNAAN